MQIPSLREAFEKKGIDPKVGFAAAEVIRGHRRAVMNSISTHHIIPHEAGGGEDPRNKRYMIHKSHDAEHVVFGNEVTPQKIRMVLEGDQTVLQPGFISAVDELVNRAERKGWIFQKGLWRGE